MARVLIAGCGYVGSALGERLTRAGLPGAGGPGTGHSVWGLRREAAGLPGGVQPFIADLCNNKSLQNIPTDLDFVFYMAAAAASTEAAYRAAYIEGLGNCLTALKSRNQNLKRFFLISSTAVYGQDTGEWVDEDSPTEGSPAGATGGSPSYGFRGRIMREAEALAMGSGFPAVVVRFGGIYGPGRTRFMERALRGDFLDSAANVRWGNRIHRDDCAGALHHIMDLNQAKLIYCVVDTEPAPQAEVARWLYERHVALKGTPAGGPPGSVQPATIIRQEGTSGDDRDILPAGMRGKRCSNRRIRAAGYLFRYPTYQEGYGALLASGGN
jgi:nucleoside-diphosphate-sugar epimerase